jgi:hypothetical protein
MTCPLIWPDEMSKWQPLSHDFSVPPAPSSPLRLRLETATWARFSEAENMIRARFSYILRPFHSPREILFSQRTSLALRVQGERRRAQESCEQQDISELQVATLCISEPLRHAFLMLQVLLNRLAATSPSVTREQWVVCV